MDDPWGSPWAEEASLPDTKPADNAKLPPVTPAKPVPPDLVNNSPWDDEEGFGDWATLPEDDQNGGVNSEDQKERSSVDWGVEEIHEKGDADITNTVDLKSGWFRRDAGNVQSKHIGLEDAPPVARGHSPDPWGSAIGFSSSERESTKEALEDVMGHNETGLPLGSSYENHDNSELSEAKNSSNGVVEEPLSSPQLDNPSFSDDDSPRASSEDTVIAVKAKHEMEAQPISSRPSSSPSDNSQHGDGYSESPRTSFEEDPKRPQLEHKQSSKVKELVKLFEGRAEGNDKELTKEDPLDTSQQSADLDSTPTPDDDAFGDFEDGENVESISNELESGKASERAASIPKSPSGPEPTVEVKTASKTTSQPPVFNIDMSLIDELCGNRATDTTESSINSKDETDVELPDSFSSTEQRKTWYRISRYGTMRKHNLGDDENYSRVSWKASEIHADTLKIVARWMEEDRIGGGVVLGGSGKLGSLFGWRENSTLPGSPRPSKAHTKSYQQQSTPKSPVERKSVELAPAKRSLDIAPPGFDAPHFGWSSSQPASAVEPQLPNRLPPNFMKQSEPSFPTVLKNQPPPISTTNRFGIQTTSEVPVQTQPFQTARPVKSSVFKPPALEKATAAISEDDDWGDMISSPVATAPSSSQEQKLRHKPSRSLTNIVSPIIPGSSFSSRSNHKPSMSLSGDSTSLPKEKNKATSMFNSVPQANNASSTSAPSSDPWASADFSFFDTITPTPTPVPIALQIHPPPSKAITHRSSPASLRPQPASSNPPTTASFARSIVPPITLHQKNSETEEERIVRNIVQNLPDFKYMLRR